MVARDKCVWFLVLVGCVLLTGCGLWEVLTVPASEVTPEKVELAEEDIKKVADAVKAVGSVLGFGPAIDALVGIGSTAALGLVAYKKGLKTPVPPVAKT